MQIVGGATVRRHVRWHSVAARKEEVYTSLCFEGMCKREVYFFKRWGKYKGFMALQAELGRSGRDADTAVVVASAARVTLTQKRPRWRFWCFGDISMYARESSRFGKRFGSGQRDKTVFIYLGCRGEAFLYKRLFNVGV